MSKESNVISFYMLCNKLKDMVRTGWKVWGVKKARLESVAEHIYGVQMLAIAMWSEYKYDIDIMKVITMLAVHEMEETIIGDITYFQKSREDKIKLGHEAVLKIFEGLTNAENIKDLIFEFDERKTPEAIFAYFCDKLECDIQCIIYDKNNLVDIKAQENNPAMQDKEVVSLLDKYNSWSTMWVNFDREKHNFDDNFNKVSMYLETYFIKKDN